MTGFFFVLAMVLWENQRIIAHLVTSQCRNNIDLQYAPPKMNMDTRYLYVYFRGKLFPKQCFLASQLNFQGVQCINYPCLESWVMLAQFRNAWFLKLHMISELLCRRNCCKVAQSCNRSITNQINISTSHISVPKPRMYRISNTIFPSQKLTWPWKITILKKIGYIFKSIFFHCHLSFPIIAIQVQMIAKTRWNLPGQADQRIPHLSSGC